MLPPKMQEKGPGYFPTTSLAAQNVSSSQHAANLSSGIPYPPYFPGHQALPPPQMYNNSAANPYLNHYIPGLTTHYDGSSAPVATSAGRDYSAQYPRPQYPIPGIGVHSFQSPPRPTVVGEFSTQASPLSKAAPVATEVPPPLDAEASSDAMDLDTREEGELSSGDVEDGETLTPESATTFPGNLRRHESQINSSNWTRHDSCDAGRMLLNVFS